MEQALEIFASRFAPPGVNAVGPGQTAVCIPTLTGSSNAFLAAILADHRNNTRDIVKVLDLRGKNADRKIHELTASLENGR